MAVTRQPVIVKRPALRGTPVSITCTCTLKIAGSPRSHLIAQSSSLPLLPEQSRGMRAPLWLESRQGATSRQDWASTWPVSSAFDRPQPQMDGLPTLHPRSGAPPANEVRVWSCYLDSATKTIIPDTSTMLPF